MISDLKNIVYSYLNLEDILILFKDNITLRDHLIDKNVEYLPYAPYEVEKKNVETVKYLIQHNYATDYKNIFNLSCGKGYLEIVELIYTKFKKDEFIEIGKVSLNYAIEGGNLDIVKFLVKHDITIYSFTCLSNAKKKGYTDVVRYLEKMKI